ncbi:MAG: LysR family transcriptional regulator [Oscillospiraceae bacterium]|nr:LysR family transcriptional regulator [Oscillospiraceae bacterium]
MNNPELYRLFRAVAEKGSFSAAAKALYVSQPAVSQGIRQLEESLGVLLFVRRPKGVTLTTEGQLLLPYVQRSLALLEAGEQKISDLKQLLIGELRIGAEQTFCHRILLPHLERFRNRYPGIRLRILQRGAEETEKMLRAGELDVAFLSRSEQMEEIPGIVSLPLLQIRDVFVAGKKFEFLRRSQMNNETLNQYPLVIPEEMCESRKYLDRIFARRGVTLRPEMELGSHDLLVTFAKLGLGIACVTKEYLLEEDDLFELPLAEKIPARTVCLAWNQKQEISFVTEAFVSWCKEGFDLENE